MTKTRLFAILGAACLLSFGPASCADAPFSVSAAVSRSPNGEPLLSVSFFMQDHHYLYAQSIKIEAAGDVSLLPRNVPTAAEKFDPLTNKTVRVYTHDITMTYAIAGNPTDPVVITVQYQGCSETMCFLPASLTLSLNLQGETGTVPDTQPESPASPPDGPARDWHELIQGFTVAGRAAGYLNPGDFLEFLDNAESGSDSDQDGLRRIFREKGTWILAILILLGGLALNLTPCVLPMIPINIAIIGAGTTAGTRARGLALGGIYGAAIALVYGVLGLLVVVTGSRFGAFNASPVFNLVVAVVFVVLSLAMFDVFTIDLSRFQGSGRFGISKQGGFVAAFFMGGLSALLAGACVAPFLISVLLLAADFYAKGRMVGLVLPFLLGAGMGLPWPFVGAGLSLLPKPGQWMVRVKQVFGIVILGMGIYYGYLGFELIAHSRTVSKISLESAEQPGQDQEWYFSLEQGLAEAGKENMPVLIDFWATWCKSCIAMDKTTFRNARVRDRLATYVRIKYKVEQAANPATEETLDHFNVMGLPTYVILTPHTKKRPARINSTQ